MQRERERERESADTMRTENALSRVNNLIRPRFVGGIEGGRDDELRVLEGSCGSCVELSPLRGPTAA